MLIELEKVHYFFKSYYSIELTRRNSCKANKFLNTGGRGKYILVSSRAMFTRLYLKLMLM